MSMTDGTILAAGALSFALSVAFQLAVAYAAYWVASQFASPSKQKMPEASTYPVQGAMKAIPISKTYGTDRVAGNIIWLGDLHPYTIKHETGGKGGGQTSVAYETRYRRSFLISVGEGPASVITAWKGKEEIPLMDFTWLDGDENTGVTSLTGEDYGEYKHNAMAFFDEYDLGNSQAIPNFSFEIATVSAYQWTYFTENSTIWGVPLTAKGTTLTLDADGVAVDYGAGAVGLPCSGNPFVAGDQIYIYGTEFYDGNRILLAGTSTRELRISVLIFHNETFDGTETVVKKIGGLEPSSGHAAIDSVGNIYYGHNWNESLGTYITKIATDGTISYDALDNTEWLSWPARSAYTVQGLDIDDDDNLYVYIPGTLCPYPVQKYDLSDGSLTWKINHSGLGASLYCDASGNAYGGFHKFDAADGNLTHLTNAGITTVYETHIDDSLGIVIIGGSGTYNMAVRTFDDSAGDAVKVGGSGSYTVGRGYVTSDGSYVYVFVVGATGPELYKYSWNGSSLSEITMISLGAAHASGVYQDLWGNLVVTNNDGTDTDIFWFYDTDLNYVTKIDGLFNQMLWTWSGTQQGEALFYPYVGSGINDVNPADVIYDLMTDTRYGAGISIAYINQASFDSCWAYWQDNNMLISLTIDESKPWKDWVDYVLSHCGGYRFLSAGQLCLGVLRDESAVDAIAVDDLVQPNPDAEILPPKVKPTKRPYSDTYNRIEISWSDRANKYDLSVAVAYDAVDIARSATKRIKKVKLLGIKNSPFAQKMAYRFLIDALYRFSIYKFMVGYKKQLLECGDVVTLTDGQLLSAEKIRLMQIQEDGHGRGLEITAMDDYAEHYPVITYSSQESLFSLPVAATLADGTVYFREDMDQPRLYLSIVPGNASVNGWYVYISYDDVSYELAGRCGIDGVTGGNANSAGTIQGSLPAWGAMTWRADEYIDVSIGTITDLPASVSEDAFWSDRNLARIASEIIAYKTASETATPGIWRISNLRRGLFGTEAAAHTAGETFCTLIKDFTYTFQPSDVGRTLYFKVLTFYGDDIQNVADVNGQSITVQGYYQRPLPASLLRLTADENDGGSGDYTGASFNLYWNLGGKDSGYNQGGYDVSGGGVPYNNYVADPELQAVVLKFEESDETAIGQREVAVGESATITKATDLAANNPAAVRVVPRRVLESRLRNKLTVDDGS